MSKDANIAVVDQLFHVRKLIDLNSIYVTLQVHWSGKFKKQYAPFKFY